MNPQIQLIAKEAIGKMKQIDKDLVLPVIETDDVDLVNVLLLSQDFCQPRLRNSKDVYSLIRRKDRQ